MSLIKLRMTESFTTYIFKDSIEIETDNYPELNGKSKEEIVEYIEENGWEMKPTNDMYDSLYEQLDDQDIIREKIPSQDSSITSSFEVAKKVISEIRNIRKSKNIPQKEKLNLEILKTEKVIPFQEIIEKLGGIEATSIIVERPNQSAGFIVDGIEFFIPMEGFIDAESEIEKLQAELKYTQGFLKSVEKKLSNERFVNNAPENVVAIEKKKQADAIEKIRALENQIAAFS